MAGEPIGTVFISYRRDDTQHVAGRLSDRLQEKNIDVFMDVDSIDPGTDFAQAIDDALRVCDVLLALIGKQWSTSTDAHGNRRLENPEDFVVLEVQGALARGIRVIPVLVDGAVMPEPDALPPGLKKLVRRNAVRIDHERFRAEADNLIATLTRILSPAHPDGAAPGAPGGLPTHGPLEPVVVTEPITDPPPPVTASPPVTPPTPVPVHRVRRGSRRLLRAMAVAVLLVVVLGGLALAFILPSDDGEGDDNGTSTTEVVESNDILESGGRLEPGEFLETPDGRHRLEMGADGSLVATTAGREWWRQEIPGTPGSWANMQDSDGNLVVYRTAAGDPVWASETTNHPGAHLAIEDQQGEGRVTIYDTDGSILWRRPAAVEPTPTTETDTSTSPTTSTTSTTSTTTVPDTTVLVTVPNVAGLESSAARNQLQAMGFEVSDVVPQASAQTKAGTAIRTEPRGGSSAPEGSAVVLYVSSG